MHKTVVINAVGLTQRLLGSSTPNLRLFANAAYTTTIGAVLPAVTTTAQATYLTGTWPNEHGIVGNGWYFRDEREVKFWRQSDGLVQRPRIWEHARRIDPQFTCANLFWWYNMYSAADFAVTPRPMYPADGRKIPDVWTTPGDLRDWLQKELGHFPLFRFWGPATSIEATAWIAEAAIRVDRRFDPTLTLIYLPHLDYCLQRAGPNPAAVANDLRDLDVIVGRLLQHYRGARVVVLSEYGIVPVSRPVHLNRVLREAGLIRVREELGRDVLDAGASAAFAVADHQVAHVYVNHPGRLGEVRRLVESTPGVARVLDDGGKREHHLDHPRSGELVALAEPDAWFTYYYWLDDRRAPDYARTVDIHRKPGYDPTELFIDPAISSPRLKLAWTLLKRRMGFRTLMELTPLDATLVRGSHGLAASKPDERPLLMSNQEGLQADRPAVEATGVYQVILDHLML